MKLKLLKLADMIAVFSIALIYYFLLFIASMLLIRGTMKREHLKLMPFMILKVIGIVIYILLISAANNADGIVIAAIMLVISFYFFICVYSLYAKMRNDRITKIQSSAQLFIYTTPHQTQPAAQQGQTAPIVAVSPAAAQFPSVTERKFSAPV